MTRENGAWDTFEDEMTDADIVRGFGVHPDFVVECVESVPQPTEES